MKFSIHRQSTSSHTRRVSTTAGSSLCGWWHAQRNVNSSFASPLTVQLDKALAQYDEVYASIQKSLQDRVDYDVYGNPIRRKFLFERECNQLIAAQHQLYTVVHHWLVQHAINKLSSAREAHVQAISLALKTEIAALEKTDFATARARFLKTGTQTTTTVRLDKISGIYDWWMEHSALSLLQPRSSSTRELDQVIKLFADRIEKYELDPMQRIAGYTMILEATEQWYNVRGQSSDRKSAVDNLQSYVQTQIATEQARLQEAKARKLNDLSLKRNALKTQLATLGDKIKNIISELQAFEKNWQKMASVRNFNMIRNMRTELIAKYDALCLEQNRLTQTLNALPSPSNHAPDIKPPVWVEPNILLDSDTLGDWNKPALPLELAPPANDTELYTWWMRNSRLSWSQPRSMATRRLDNIIKFVDNTLRQNAPLKPRERESLFALVALACTAWMDSREQVSERAPIVRSLALYSINQCPNFDTVSKNLLSFVRSQLPAEEQSITTQLNKFFAPLTSFLAFLFPSLMCDYSAVLDAVALFS